ncbi:MAG: DUF1127 domain-containing protein [Dongiaceae bacterium]
MTSLTAKGLLSPVRHPGWLRAVADGVRGALAAARERRIRRRAARELARFDDRLLADIGIGRGEIGAVVARLRQGPRRPG